MVKISKFPRAENTLVSHHIKGSGPQAYKITTSIVLRDAGLHRILQKRLHNLHYGCCPYDQQVLITSYRCWDLLLPLSAGLDAEPNPVLEGAPNPDPAAAVVFVDPNTVVEPKVLP